MKSEYTLIRINRERNVEMIPEPGPISRIIVDFMAWICSNSFSRESRNKKESWSGSYLQISAYTLEYMDSYSEGSMWSRLGVSKSVDAVFESISLPF